MTFLDRIQVTPSHTKSQQVNLTSFIDKALLRLRELEAAIAAFDFHSAEQKRYFQLNQEYQKLKRLQNTWQELQKTRRELQE